jgi:acetyl-CoA carboxylase carboxyl transferase subunit alpha
MHYLEFERPIAELEGKIVELKKLAEDDPSMANACRYPGG